MAKKSEKPKVSKRVKITFDSVNKDKITPIVMKDLVEGFVKVDMTKIYQERQKELDKTYKENQAKYQRDKKTEDIRREKLSCPSCKSIKKFPVKITHIDGPVIYGGHNSVQTLAEYNVCQNCGVMYVDLNKKDIEAPRNHREDFRFFN